MKSVYSSHSELCHVWANQTPAELASNRDGRASNMAFCGRALFSYQTTIARHVAGKGGRRGFLLTSHKFSNSTSKHLSHAFRSIGYERPDVFRVCADSRGQSMDWSGATVFAHYRAEAEQAATDALKPRIRQHTREAHLARAIDLVSEANRAREFFGLRCKPLVADTQALQASVAKRTAAQEKANAKRAKEHAARMAELEAILARYQPSARAAWRASDHLEMARLADLARAEGVEVSAYTLARGTGGNYLLRLSADRSRIETSQGAQVLTRTVAFIWPYCYAARKAGFPVSCAILERFPRLDNYSADAIDAAGNLRAGCHQIPFAEVEYIAKKLGLPAEPLAPVLIVATPSAPAAD